MSTGRCPVYLLNNTLVPCQLPKISHELDFEALRFDRYANKSCGRINDLFLRAHSFSDTTQNRPGDVSRWCDHAEYFAAASHEDILQSSESPRGTRVCNGH